MTKEKSNDINIFINFLKEKGFVYSGSEIYGGLANTWDYGPLGSLLKNNLKSDWIKEFVINQDNNFLIDSSILLNPKVWEASGHVAKFNDPLIDCKTCKKRFRADHLIEEYSKQNPNKLTHSQMSDLIQSNIKCPSCNSSNWTEVREFKLMFELSNSKTNPNEDVIYLRPETAQGVYINFNNYKGGIFGKLPFGIGQIGKAFRNEITPGNFIFRTKEFEQMELEFYSKENEEEIWFDYYEEKTKNFLETKLGISKENYRLFDVPKDELAHYSKKTIDFEYKYPFGWGELLGIANRGNFDLSNHSKHSGVKLNYLDEQSNEFFTPSIIETSMGVERLFFATLWEAWINRKDENYLPIPIQLAPYKVVILPLTKNQISLSKQILEKHIKSSLLINNYLVLEKGNIGKRYKRADEMGIPFAITIDEQTIDVDGKVTIRDARTRNQISIKLNELDSFFIKNK